jgi:Fe-S-cluster containining protein
MTLTERDVSRLEAAGFRGFCREAASGELRLRNRDGRCVLLGGGRCRAYDARPEGCRLYPLVLDLDDDRVVLHTFCPHRREFRFEPEDERRLRRSVEQDERESERRLLRRMARSALLLLLLVGGLAVAAEPPPEQPRQPWEVWRDLASLAVIPLDDRVVMRSSYCREGCELDRHSSGDSRFLRSDSNEGVLFEGAGPGAVTRIWMTQGDDGVSRPLDPEIWIRIAVDGEIVVQLPLPDFFAGDTPPFRPPLVSHRLIASGGNVSYVPIPYRQSCVISLLGAEHAKIWFQITAHEVDGATDVVRFTGEEDLGLWRGLLATDPGADPWRGGPYPTTSGPIQLRRGARVAIAAFAGADVLNGLLLRIPRDSWGDVELRLLFDGEVRVSMPVADFFAAGEPGADPIRSLLVGATADEDLYAYFPMPFFEGAVVELARDRSRGRGRKIPVEYAIRRLDRPPDPASGLFGAALRSVDETAPGRDHEILRLAGRGKWVGLAARIGSRTGSSRDYLEGDERIVIDGAAAPQLHGTGVEDFFGGGFYFQIDRPGPVPFGHPLHGMVDDRVTADGGVVTSMYRLMLTDAPVWRRSVAIGLECGPTNQTPIRAATVAYYYSGAAVPSAEPRRVDLE